MVIRNRPMNRRINRASGNKGIVSIQFIIPWLYRKHTVCIVNNHSRKKQAKQNIFLYKILTFTRYTSDTH